MSNDSGIQVSKSVLSPHVAEFIPSSFAKNANQVDTKHPTKTTSVQNSNKPHEVVTDEKGEKHFKSFGKPRKPFAQNHEYDKRPISSSWRAPDIQESGKTDNAKTKDSFVTYDKNNWRYREGEQTVDSQKTSSSQTRRYQPRNESTRQEEADSPRKPISFQTSLRSNIAQSQDQSRTFHRGIGRGRGRSRGAWTNNFGQTVNDSKVTLDESAPSSSSFIGCGQGVSYSDKLKGIDTKPKTESLERIKTENAGNNSIIQDKTHGFSRDIKKDDDSNEWTKANRTKVHSEQQTAYKEYKRTLLENSGHEKDKAPLLNSTIDKEDEGRGKKRARKYENTAELPRGCGDFIKNRDRKSVKNSKGDSSADNKEITQSHKTRWKGNKQFDKLKTSQQQEQSSSLMMNKPLDKHSTSTVSKTLESKEVPLKQPEKNLTMTKIGAASNDDKSKKIKLLKKNEDMPIENRDMFELVQSDSEFPDLRSTGNKSGESTSLASDWLSGGSRMPIISYSAALKTIPKPLTRQPQNKDDNSGKALEGGNGESQAKKKKKKKKKKSKDKNEDPGSKPVEVVQQKSAKKTKQPIQLDLGDWLSALHKPSNKTKPDKSSSKKVTLATGVLQINRQTAANHQPSSSKTTTTTKGLHNILDSTAPVVKRGKEREVPKKKKPSALKKIILKEREEKKKALDGESQDGEHITEDKDSGSKQTPSAVTQHDETEEGSRCISSVNDKKDETLTGLLSDDDDKAQTHSTGSVNDKKDETLSGLPSEDDIKAQIHSRRFREYCDNVMDKELNNTTTELLQKLVVFQDRQYHKDPIKSKAKRRYVVGLREVTKHLNLKKIKLVIISPNVERIKSAGGLDDTLHNIVTIAHQNGIPVVFALRRQILGRILHKKVPVSAVGVFNYDGAQDHFKELMDLTEKARAVYAERWKKAYDELMEQIKKETANEQLHQQEETTGQVDNSQECSSSDENDVDNSDNEQEGEDTDHKKPDNLAQDETASEDQHLDVNVPTIEMDMNVEDL